MTWYWYVARSNEIFCDLDSKRAVARALNVLRRAIRKKMLDVEAVFFYPSLSNYHLVVVLNEQMCTVDRVNWALWMGSDRLRSVYVLARYRRGVWKSPDILCTPRQWADGFRFMDDRCDCKSKHKEKRVTDKCPAMKRLLGDERSGDYFPRNTDRKERTKPLKMPWGRVPKRLLLEY
jgi:hypothetical protein